MLKRISIIVLLVLIMPLYVRAEEVDLAPNAKSALIMEASTGEIIWQKNVSEKLPPASLTKMMGMLLVVESVDKGIIKWNDMVTVSENASKMGGSQILLEIGEQMSVADLFKGVAVASGNDAIVALGEKIAGTEELFVKMMNDRARELGLKNTNYKNPHGLEEENHYTSAYDLSIIARELVKHPKVLENTSIYEDYLRKGTDKEFWLVNTNRLVRFYQGVDGLKTGYTVEAGYCLVATAMKNNMRIIAIVLGEPESAKRNSEISLMFDYSFSMYSIEKVLSTTSVLKRVKVIQGKDEQADLVPSWDVNVLNNKNLEKRNVTYNIRVDTLKAPIKKGDIVGTLEIVENDRIIDEVNITVAKNIKKASLMEQFLKNIKYLLSGNI